jgi:hypothetical protein
MSAIALITALSRTQYSDSQARAVRELVSSDIDWSQVLTWARWHYVLPLLWRGLGLLGERESIPEPVAEYLRAASAEIARHNMVVASELRNVVAGLNRSGIEVIPLRGASLAIRLYGDLNLRCFADIDILVRPEKLMDAARSLREMGIHPKKNYTAQQLNRLVREDCEWHFATKEGTDVELHWRAFPHHMGLRRLEDGIWRGSEPRTLLGQSVRALSNEDLAVMLCLHNGGKHGWSQLRWVCDFSELMMARGVDWSAVVDRAHEVGALRWLRTGAAVVRRTIGLESDSSAAAAIGSDPVAEALASEQVGRLFDFRFAQRPEISLFRSPPHHFRMRDRVRDKVAYLPVMVPWLLKATFVPTDKELRRLWLPKGLRVLLVPFRLSRLAAKYMGRAFRHPSTRDQDQR